MQYNAVNNAFPVYEWTLHIITISVIYPQNNFTAAINPLILFKLIKMDKG